MVTAAQLTALEASLKTAEILHLVLPITRPHDYGEVREVDPEDQGQDGVVVEHIKQIQRHGEGAG